MNGKGHSDEISDKNEENVVGGTAIFIVKWQRIWPSCAPVLVLCGR